MNNLSGADGLPTGLDVKPDLLANNAIPCRLFCTEPKEDPKNTSATAVGMEEGPLITMKAADAVIGSENSWTILGGGSNGEGNWAKTIGLEG